MKHLRYRLDERGSFVVLEIPIILQATNKSCVVTSTGNAVVHDDTSKVVVANVWESEVWSEFNVSVILDVETCLLVEDPAFEA